MKLYDRTGVFRPGGRRSAFLDGAEAVSRVLPDGLPDGEVVVLTEEKGIELGYGPLLEKPEADEGTARQARRATRIAALQAAGLDAMAVDDFLNIYANPDGAFLGEEEAGATEREVIEVLLLETQERVAAQRETAIREEAEQLGLDEEATAELLAFDGNSRQRRHLIARLEADTLAREEAAKEQQSARLHRAARYDAF